MPVLPEYQATQAPGANAQNFLNGYEQVSSLMERKQRLAMAQENQDMERAKFQAFLPAILAKGQADQASAVAAIANTARIEQLRSQAAASSIEYNGEFLNIMNIPDTKTRSDELGLFMGKIAWMDNPALPEYQGFTKAVRDERAKSFTEATTNFKLDQHLEEQSQAWEAKKEMAQRNAVAAEERALIRANAPTAVQKIADALQYAKETGADSETVEGLRKALAKTSARAEQMSVVERAISNRDAALQAGDRARAQVFQDEINKATSFASDPIKNPLPASTAKTPAGEAPAKEIKLPSGATIKIREKTAK